MEQAAHFYSGWAAMMALAAGGYNAQGAVPELESVANSAGSRLMVSG
jgi:hypothetical protein